MYFLFAHISLITDGVKITQTIEKSFTFNFLMPRLVKNKHAFLSFLGNLNVYGFIVFGYIKKNCHFFVNKYIYTYTNFSISADLYARFSRIFELLLSALVPRKTAWKSSHAMENEETTLGMSSSPNLMLA